MDAVIDEPYFVTIADELYIKKYRTKRKIIFKIIIYKIIFVIIFKFF